MSSRSWVTVEPVTAALSAAASVCELRPSRRASSWSIRTRTWRAGSFQSKLMRRALGSVATTCASLSAISRTWSMSGPLTRYCTGQPTGGPSSSGEIRLTTPGKSLASTCSSRFCKRSRAATSLATITAWAKKSFGSCTFRGR
jgi:hypothetical protein